MSACDTDVAIVGAGAAGIAAARRLADTGYRILLIDALDRLGGRAWTMKVEGMALDLGCGWLHSAERNPWVDIAAASGHPIDRTLPGWGTQFRDLGFDPADQRAAGNAFAAFDAALRERPPASDRALDAIDPASPWLGYVEALSSYINGAQLAELSVADYLAYDDAASETNWRLPDGYGTLIAAHAGDLPRALSTRVEAVAHAPEGVRIATDRGAIAARGAIVTVSSDILARGALRLPSAFDDACHAAAHLPLGLADKLFLRVAAGDAPPEAHLIGNPRTAETGSYHLGPFGRPIVECFFGGTAARALEAEGIAGMVAFARAELGALLGPAFARTLEPLAASCWARVPSIGGSYSHALPGHADARRLLAAPVDDLILLAGEACSSRDFSTAHGAYASGIAAADRLEPVLRRAR